VSRKEYFLVGLVVVLVGLYVVCFTDWFRPGTLRIEHSTRVLREAWNGAQRVDSTGKEELGNVSFTLHGTFMLDSVKVVPLAEYLTNKYVPPTWALESGSGSDPVSGFAYGMNIAGMKPVHQGRTPELLEPGRTYRLIVEAGRVRGEHDFSIGGTPAALR
jgi:hypothetical protein